MNIRSLLLQSLALSLAMVMRGETIATGAADRQPSAVVSNPENPPPNRLPRAGVVRQTPQDYAKIFGKKYESATPLVLREELDPFPEKPIELVRVFESMGAFNKFLSQGKPTVSKLGEFQNVVRPTVEAEFRQVLLTHAAKSGADYLVILTNPMEIGQNFDVEAKLPLVYCAVVYKRAEARLGIEPDPDALKKKNITKIVGFTPGSRAKESGLNIGDVISKVDGEPKDGLFYWNKALRWKTGDKVKVEVEREGKTVEVEVKLVAG